MIQTNATILEGHNISLLKTLPENSVHTVVTSPPYYGLRDYGLPAQIWGGDEFCEHEFVDETFRRRSSDTKSGNEKKKNLGSTKRDAPIQHGFCLKCNAWRGSLGLEPTPQLFVENLVSVFREVWRVLRHDGTLWLNLGDSYANDGKWGGSSGGKHVKELHGNTGIGRQKVFTGLKPKNLIGIPWLVAFALQRSGWILRQDIVWAKNNPMPESVTDRFTKAHEYIFLLTKSQKYFFDNTAIQEPQAEYERLRRLRERDKGLETVFNISRDGQTGLADQSANGAVRSVKRRQELAEKGTRNKRSVWTVSSIPFAEAHFATFPEKLIEPCILAGTSEKGCCADCGAPYVRIVAKELVPTAKASFNSIPDARDFAADKNDQGSNRIKNGHKPGWCYSIDTTGWRKSCSCETDEVKPCVVMDPFNGAGTTGKVSLKHKRDYIGIELNPEYVEMSRRGLSEIQVKLF